MPTTNPGSTGGKVVEGANLAVYTVVVIAIIVVANWFVNNHDKKWDLTPNQKYSLSPQTEKILKGLDRDVTLYVFNRKSEQGENRDLLQNYAAASRHLALRYVDPDGDPALSKELGVRTYGTIVVAAGDRHIEAQAATEEGISTALIRVLKGQKSIYFVEGSGERNLDSADTDRDGYSRVKKDLENESYEVKTVNLLQTMQIPADCALLVIAGPKHDYLPPEVDAIKKYLEGGGRALVMFDPLVDPSAENPTNLAGLLAGWNVTLQNDLVIDQNPVAQMFGTSPAMPLIIKYGSSPIVEPLARVATLFPYTRSFEIGKDEKPGVVDTSLCDTSGASFGVADFNAKMQKVSFRAGTDYKGPLTVAVAGSVTATGGDKKEGRFVALGTSSLAANNYLGFQGNRDFFMNSVNWLTAEEDLISIRPKPPESQHLNLTQSQMSRIFYLGLIGAPLIIILIGVTVWWGRR
ncbi:MAG TPA: GldG family protein [Terriglobia bacterium]|nr:GldG family protein [Terriglobia bacterium]